MVSNFPPFTKLTASTLSEFPPTIINCFSSALILISRCSYSLAPLNTMRVVELLNWLTLIDSVPLVVSNLRAGFAKAEPMISTTNLAGLSKTNERTFSGRSADRYRLPVLSLTSVIFETSTSKLK